jgi:predicted  nucleic acid-binding Zn-ribbon protein
VGPPEESLKDQLRLLEDLQQHDAKLQEMQTALDAIPARLKRSKADLQRVEDMLTQERTQLAETEAYHRDQQRELANEEQLMQKAKIKLQAVKNSKEYMATQREMESTRKMASEREEEVIKLLAAIEEFKKKIAAHEADVNVIREQVAKDEAEAQSKVAEMQAQYDAAKKERDELAKAVKPDIMRRYSSIRLKRGLAVVPVKNGTCTGCHMNIPPQLFNQLQRAISIETCPNCHRIVYWDKIMEAQQEERAEQPDQNTNT